MGSSKIKTVDMSESIDEPKSTGTKKAKKNDPGQKPEKNEPKAKNAPVVTKKVRSKRYVKARSQVDKTTTYSLDKAIPLIKKISRKNHPTLTADINYKEEGFQTELTLPHFTGKKIKVAIATEELLAKIEKGQLDFDILIATPDIMGKVAKVARILGPKGLMPNPKNQTVTKNPEKRKKELEAGKITVRTERKAPIIHLQVGNITQADKELIANINTLVKYLNPVKINRLTLSTTMSPGIKIDLSCFTTE